MKLEFQPWLMHLRLTPELIRDSVADMTAYKTWVMKKVVEEFSAPMFVCGAREPDHDPAVSADLDSADTPTVVSLPARKP